MTSLQFMEKEFGVSDGQSRWCSSIYKDARGTIYSDGYHYPLLMKVRGRNFINIAGYSTTTSRHISWAWKAVDYHGFGVKLDPTTRGLGFEQAVNASLKNEYKDVREQMASKKRKDTRIYAHLTHRLNQIKIALTVFGEASGEGINHDV